MQPAGVIRQIARFPVKSMRGEALSSATLTLQGFDEDRRYAFVQAASRGSFPWLTARELPAMLLYQAAVDRPGSPDVAVTVTAPDGQSWPIDSDELKKLLEDRSGRALFLLRDYRGSYDAAAVSLISRQTVERIAAESGTAADPWRFRPNLVVDLEGGAAFDEMSWVGRILRVGDTARIAVTQPDQRCVMITLDPSTAEPSPAILRSVVQQHGKCAGVYGAVIATGEIRAGDRISLEP